MRASRLITHSSSYIILSWAAFSLVCVKRHQITTAAGSEWTVAVWGPYLGEVEAVLEPRARFGRQARYVDPAVPQAASICEMSLEFLPVSPAGEERQKVKKQVQVAGGGQGFNSTPQVGHLLFHTAALCAPTTIPTKHLLKVSYFVVRLIEALCFSFFTSSHSTHWFCEAWGSGATSEETLEGGWATILINKVNALLFFLDAREHFICKQHAENRSQTATKNLFCLAAEGDLI